MKLGSKVVNIKNDKIGKIVKIDNGLQLIEIQLGDYSIERVTFAQFYNYWDYVKQIKEPVVTQKPKVEKFNKKVEFSPKKVLQEVIEIANEYDMKLEIANDGKDYMFYVKMDNGEYSPTCPFKVKPRVTQIVFYTKKQYMPQHLIQKTALFLNKTDFYFDKYYTMYSYSKIQMNMIKSLIRSINEKYEIPKRPTTYKSHKKGRKRVNKHKKNIYNNRTHYKKWKWVDYDKEENKQEEDNKEEIVVESPIIEEVKIENKLINIGGVEYEILPQLWNGEENGKDRIYDTIKPKNKEE